MALTIDNLQIEIESNARSATKGIDSLAKSLEKLKTAVGDTSGLASNLKDIASALSTFGSVGKIKLTSPINQLKKLEQLIPILGNSQAKQMATNLRDIANSLAAFSATSGVGQQIRDSVSGMNALSKEMNKVSKSNTKLSSSLTRTVSRFWLMYYTVKRVSNVFADWYNESNEYIESLNLFKVTMGEASDAALDYANEVSRAMGIDVAEWITNQGTFQRMATGFGIASDQANVMSQNLTQLAYDMASFFNADVETAMDKLQSGMSGQIKGLKAWGYNLSVAALQETALSLGIEQSVRTMTEAQKAQLRYITLIQRSNGIMGDMAKTIVTPANSMRVLSAQITRFQRALGNLVSVLATRFIPYIMAAVELMTEFAESMAVSWGFEIEDLPTNNLDMAADVIEGIGDETDDTTDSVKDLKKQLMGFDELNILKSDDANAGNEAQYDLGIDLPSYDFMNGLSGDFRERIDAIKEEFRKFIDVAEDVITVGSGIAAIFAFNWVVDSVAKFKKLTVVSAISSTLLGALQNAQLVFEGTGSAITALGHGFKYIWTSFSSFMKNLSPVTKGLISIIALVSEFTIVKDAMYDVTKGSKTVGQALKRIIPITAAVGVAMYAMLGPWGAVAVAVAGVAGAIKGVVDAQTDLEYEMLKTDYYKVQGRAIGEVRDALSSYFNSMDFDKQSQWVQTIKDAQSSYDDACSSYDEMWQSIADKPVFDASDIEGLTEAFNDLADAARALNNAKIDSLMASIKTGIEMNITPELEGRLDGLIGKIEEAHILLGNEFTNLSKEYQDILNEVTNNNGVITNEQKEQLKALRNEMSKFTLSDDNKPTERWNIEIQEALKNAINAGTNKEEVLENVEDLASDRDTYLNALKEKYAADRNTLAQLIELDKNEFGGQLGFKDTDLKDLDASYLIQINAVKLKYNQVLEKIIDTYKEGMYDYDTYHQGGLYDLGAWLTSPFGIKSQQSGLTGEEYFARQKLSEEQRELLEELRKYLLSMSMLDKFIGLKGYASGGFPTMGQMFIARERGPELVGSIGNKTAVANNDQIITGIATGVYNAMMAAKESNGGGGSARIIVQIGDRAVGEAAVDYINGQIVQTGVNPLYT